MGEGVRVALRLILLTAQRPGEVCSMEWDELDLEGGWWAIPREKTKGDRAHRVPLNHLALEVLAGWPRGDGPWVFPSRQGKPLKVLALSQEVRLNRGHFGLPRFTPHDLRRTAASHLGAVGVDRFILGRLLNHSDREVTGIYDRYSYDEQKSRAMEKWSAKLCRILGREVDQEKVVSIGDR